jgi:very-short-patch-repair endonuclease
MTNKTEARKQIDREQRESLKREFLTRWRQLNGPELQEEFKFHAERGFKFDFAYTQNGLKVAIELEGGTWLNKGGHTTGQGYTKDCTKYNLANLDNWRLFRFTTDMLTNDPVGHLLPIIELMRGR